MKNSIFTRFLLSVSGALAALIGGGIVLMPDAFYDSYQVLLPQSASLRSELKGMGSFLIFCGGLILAGAMRTVLRPMALILGGGLYGSFSTGRLLSWVIDGSPSSAILAAWCVEAAIFVLIVAAGLVNRKHKFSPATNPVQS